MNLWIIKGTLRACACFMYNCNWGAYRRTLGCSLTLGGRFVLHKNDKPTVGRNGLVYRNTDGKFLPACRLLFFRWFTVLRLTDCGYSACSDGRDSRVDDYICLANSTALKTTPFPVHLNRKGHFLYSLSLVILLQ